MSDFIYHLAPESEFAAGTRETGEKSEYLPSRFAEDGFIHCTGDVETLVLVANDYFRETRENLLILKVRINSLRAPLKFEPPAPIPGGGTDHLREGLLFPHIYGPLNLDAVVERGILPRTEKGFIAPDKFA